MRAAAIAILIAGFGVIGSSGCRCKEPRSYDLTSPEATVRSFFAAINAGRIPQDLEKLMISDRDLGMWRQRCELDGCGTAELMRMERAESTRSSAVVRIDYRLSAKSGGTLARVRDVPVYLILAGRAWKIAEFGEYRTVGDKPAASDLKSTGDPPSSRRDAASAGGSPPPASP